MLFYFAIDASIYAGIGGYWYRPSRKKVKAGYPAALAAGFGALLMTSQFAYFLSRMAGEHYILIQNSERPQFDLFVAVIVTSWPLFIYKAIMVYLTFRKMDRKTIETESWENAIHSIMSVFLSFAITLFVLSLIEINHSATVISSLLISRVIFDIYLYRTVLGLQLPEKK